MVTVLKSNSITDHIRSVLFHNELIGFLKPIEANYELYFRDKLLIKVIVWELYENWNESCSENKLDKHHAFACGLHITSNQLFNAIE